jgi:predicted TIM-barrel fold metal-dependent hydrolase
MSKAWSRRDFAKLGAAGLTAAAGCQSGQVESATDAQVEPATDSSGAGLKIIDPHVHVWVNDPRYPWPAENTNPPKEDYTPEMLLALMEQHGVAHTVIVHPMHYRWDCRFVGDTLKKYPDKFRGVCRVNPEAADAADALTKWTEEWGFHGVRLSPSANASGDWIENAALMDPIWKRAAELRVPMCILTRPARLPAIAALAARYPELDVVIDHMADCPPADLAQRQLLLDLARLPRTHVKISHTWSISEQEYPWRDTWDLVKSVHGAFGAERIMWGTDWPVSLSKTDYGSTLRLITDAMDFFSDADKSWILSKSVERLWPFS